MTINWIEIAKARGISPADPERCATVLNSLDSVFQPLLADLAFETEPAIILSEPAVEGR